MDALDSDILIRELRADEEKTLRAFYGKNLGIIDTIIFNLSFSDVLKSAYRVMGTTFIATKSDRIVGSFSVKVQTYREKQVGLSIKRIEE